MHLKISTLSLRSLWYIDTCKWKNNYYAGWRTLGFREILRGCFRIGIEGMFNLDWRRKWQPTPLFLPGKSRGQRSLEGYNPWGRKELDMTELLHFLPSFQSWLVVQKRLLKWGKLDQRLIEEKWESIEQKKWKRTHF